MCDSEALAKLSSLQPWCRLGLLPPLPGSAEVHAQALGTFQVLHGCCPERSVLHWAAHTWQLAFLSRREREQRGCARQKPESFVTKSWKWHPITLAILCSSEMNPYAQTTLQWEDYKSRYEYSEARVVGVILKAITTGPALNRMPVLF